MAPPLRTLFAALFVESAHQLRTVTVWATFTVNVRLRRLLARHLPTSQHPKTTLGYVHATHDALSLVQPACHTLHPCNADCANHHCHPLPISLIPCGLCTRTH